MDNNDMNLLTRSLILAVILNASSALAAGTTPKPAYTAPAQTNTLSTRLIVRLKPTFSTAGKTPAQIASELRHPFSVATMGKLQTAAGMALTESHAISNGAHILVLPGSPDKESIARAIANIRGLSEVDYVEEDRVKTPKAPPNAAEYNLLWGLQPVTAIASPAPGYTGNYGADFQTAWTRAWGVGIVVAVIDTGITAHTDIVGAGGTVLGAPVGNLKSPGYTFISDCRIRGSTATGGCAATAANTSPAPTPDASDTGDFISSVDSTTPGSVFEGMPTSDSSWHGTHVSGTIAAIGGNNITEGGLVVGGAYASTILPVRVLGKGGGYSSDIVEGMLWAADVHASINNPNPAKVLNLSLGGSGACSTTEQDAIDAIVAAGTVIIVAAGNEDSDVATSSPANCNNVISVASIGRDGSRAYYSNYSSPSSNTTNPKQITIAAQGADKSLSLGGYDLGIYSTVNASLDTPSATHTYAYYQGTSMATPHVAAAAALMLSVTNLSPTQIKYILSASTTDFPSFSTAGWATYDCATLKNCGEGILNAKLAVQNSFPARITPSTSELYFGTIASGSTISNTVTLNAGLLLGTAVIRGLNSSMFHITNDTCSGVSSSCSVTINYSPTAYGVNTATLFIPANPATSGAVVVGLTGTSTIVLTPAQAITATRGTGDSGGGCSVMGSGATPDISLLLAMAALLAYSLRRRLAVVCGKN
jgi:serine protease